MFVMADIWSAGRKHAYETGNLVVGLMHSWIGTTSGTSTGIRDAHGGRALIAVMIA